MNGFALVLVTATLGVDYGWQPASDGRLEYIIQIEPVTLIALREGQELLSHVDPHVQDVRRFRIRVGSDLVPRVGTPLRNGNPGFPPDNALPPEAGISYGWQPIDAGQLEFIVQISPERLVLLKNGEDIVGQIPPEVPRVARFRLRSAADQLPRIGLPDSATPSTGVALASASQPRNDARKAAGANTTPEGRAAPSNGTGNGQSPSAGATAASSNAMQNAQQWQAQGREVVPPPGTNTSAVDNARYRSRADIGNVAIDSPSGADPARSDTSPQVWPPRAPTSVRGSFDPGSQPAPHEQSVYGPAADGAEANGRGQGAQHPARQGGAWQQPAVQSVVQPPARTGQPQVQTIQPQVPSPDRVGDTSSGWTSSTGSDQSWPPPSREPTQTAEPAGNGAYGGWDQRPPAGGYQAHAQGQYGATPNSPSQDYLAPTGVPGPPAYGTAPYGQTPSAPAVTGTGASNPGNAYPPYSSPGFQAATPPPGYGASPGASAASIQRPQPNQDWQLTNVSFGTAIKRKASPLVFWDSLAATANDPSLAYLRDDGGSAKAEEAWWPLTLAMLALFASMGGNLYMGWIAVDVYRRYLDAATDEYEDDDLDPPRDYEERAEADDGWRDRGRRHRRRSAVGT
jgi:hypothetical protein